VPKRRVLSTVLSPSRVGPVLALEGFSIGNHQEIVPKDTQGVLHRVREQRGNGLLIRSSLNYSSLEQSRPRQITDEVFRTGGGGGTVVTSTIGLERSKIQLQGPSSLPLYTTWLARALRLLFHHKAPRLIFIGMNLD